MFLFGSVAFSRVIYALCWFNLAAAFPAMSVVFHYSLQTLAYFTSAFLVGTAIFQVPAGIFSARTGATKAALIGLSIIGVTSIISALTGEFYIQTITRFFTGVGAAFYFAPAIVIVSDTLGQGKSGLAIGLFNGSFNLGGGLALLIFTPLSAIFDWRLPFVVCAILTFLAIAENAYAFKGVVSEVRAEISRVGATLKSRGIWIAVLAIFGTTSAFYVVSQFDVAYAEGQLRLTPVFAGAISSLTLLGAVAGAPIGGWLSDRFKNRRLLIALSAVGAGGAIGLFAVQNPYTPWIAAFMSGFFVLSANTIAFAIPIQMPEIGRRYAPIAMGMMNSVGIFGGSIATVIFANLVLLFGYDASWVVLAIFPAVFAPLIYLAIEPFKTKEEAHIKK